MKRGCLCVCARTPHTPRNCARTQSGGGSFVCAQTQQRLIDAEARLEHHKTLAARIRHDLVVHQAKLERAVRDAEAGCYLDRRLTK
jgi:hypothetical protein